MGSGGGSGNFPNTQGGRQNSIIHRDRQDNHIEGTKNYNQQVANGRHPSILTDDPHQLLKVSAGKGTMIIGANKEIFDFGRLIGKYYHPNTQQYHDTTRGIIHYDSNGYAHIVPSRPNDFDDKKRGGFYD